MHALSDQPVWRSRQMHSAHSMIYFSISRCISAFMATSRRSISAFMALILFVTESSSSSLLGITALAKFTIFFGKFFTFYFNKFAAQTLFRDRIPTTSSLASTTSKTDTWTIRSRASGGFNPSKSASHYGSLGTSSSNLPRSCLIINKNL